MTTFEYKDKLRVTVGELTRAQQLQFWKDGHLVKNQTENDGSNGMLATALLEDSVTVLCTTAIEVNNGGKWKSISTPMQVELNGTEYELSYPMTLERYRQLPASLVNQWASRAIELNGDVTQVLFLASLTLTATPNGSKEASENEP